jgi:hypothetical protein
VTNTTYSPSTSESEAAAITSTIWETGSSAEIMFQMLWESPYFRQSQRIVKYDPHLHLFAASCARRTARLFISPESRMAIQTAERFATGAATRSEMHRAHLAAEASTIATLRAFEEFLPETVQPEQQNSPLNPEAIRNAAILNAASAAASCCLAHQLFGPLQAADLSAKFTRKALYWEALAHGADSVLITELLEEEDLRQAHTLRTFIGNPFNSIEAPAMLLPTTGTPFQRTTPLGQHPG